MIRQCFLTNTVIRFHSDLLKTVGLDPSSLYPIVQPRHPPVSSLADIGKRAPKFIGANTIAPETQDAAGSTVCVDMAAVALTEEEEDLIDALCPIYDQLVLNRAWWLVEILPLEHSVQRDDDSWTTEIT